MTKFGVHVTPEGAPMAELQSLWLLAERLGYEWVSVWDHFLPMLRNDDSGSFEGIACQAALAQATSTVRVGSLVYSAGYRHPMVLAAAAATIDHISAGRMELGLGAGWCPAEYEAFGIEFEPPGVRLRRLRETVQIIKRLWSEDAVDHEGEFFTLQNAHVHAPHQQAPRIWLGVMGDAALKIAGEVADGWNCPSVTPDQFAQKRDLVLGAAADPDRMVTSVGINVLLTAEADLDAVIRRRAGASALRYYRDWSPTGTAAASGTVVGSVEAVRDQVGRYAEAGADWIILRLMAPFFPEELESFATQVMPHFSDTASDR